VAGHGATRDADLPVRFVGLPARSCFGTEKSRNDISCALKPIDEAVVLRYHARNTSVFRQLYRSDASRQRHQAPLSSPGHVLVWRLRRTSTASANWRTNVMGRSSLQDEGPFMTMYLHMAERRVREARVLMAGDPRWYSVGWPAVRSTAHHGPLVR
jgi:hypothetical protein